MARLPPGPRTTLGQRKAAGAQFRRLGFGNANGDAAAAADSGGLARNGHRYSSSWPLSLPTGKGGGERGEHKARR